MDNSREGELSSGEDRLQGCDDSGDNDTYLEVQPVDNSGEDNDEQDDDEESVYYDSDENPHPREHLRQDGVGQATRRYRDTVLPRGQATRRYHGDANSQWFLHYPDLYPEGWRSERRPDNDHGNHAATTGTTTSRLGDYHDAHARTTGTTNPSEASASVGVAATVRWSAINPNIENPEVTCSEDDDDAPRLAEWARQRTTTRTGQRMDDIASIRAASIAATEVEVYAAQHAVEVEDTMTHGELRMLGAAARRYLRDMGLVTRQGSSDPTRWGLVRHMAQDPTPAEPRAAAASMARRTVRTRSRTRSRTRIAGHLAMITALSLMARPVSAGGGGDSNVWRTSYGDQLDLPDVSAIERRLHLGQMVEYHYKYAEREKEDELRRDKKVTGPTIDESELFLGVGKSACESMICPNFTDGTAKQLEGDTNILKSTRKAREERAQLRK